MRTDSLNLINSALSAIEGVYEPYVKRRIVIRGQNKIGMSLQGRDSMSRNRDTASRYCDRWCQHEHVLQPFFVLSVMMFIDTERKGV